MWLGKSNGDNCNVHYIYIHNITLYTVTGMEFWIMVPMFSVVILPYLFLVCLWWMLNAFCALWEWIWLFALNRLIEYFWEEIILLLVDKFSLWVLYDWRISFCWAVIHNMTERYPIDLIWRAYLDWNISCHVTGWYPEWRGMKSHNMTRRTFMNSND